MSTIAKDLSHLRQEFHAEKLRRRSRIAVILTSETPNIAQEAAISLVARGKVDLATSTHTMIGDVAIVLLTVTTTVEKWMTTLMATGIITLATREEDTIT